MLLMLLGTLYYVFRVVFWPEEVVPLLKLHLFPRRYSHYCFRPEVLGFLRSNLQVASLVPAHQTKRSSSDTASLTPDALAMHCDPLLSCVSLLPCLPLLG